MAAWTCSKSAPSRGSATRTIAASMPFSRWKSACPKRRQKKRKRLPLHVDNQLHLRMNRALHHHRAFLTERHHHRFPGALHVRAEGDARRYRKEVMGEGVFVPEHHL